MTGLSCSTQILSCGMQDLVPWSGIEPRPPALEAWSLSHWTTRKAPRVHFYIKGKKLFDYIYIKSLHCDTITSKSADKQNGLLNQILAASRLHYHTEQNFLLKIGKASAMGWTVLLPNLCPPGAGEYVLTWKQSICKCGQIKKSYQIKVGPDSMASDLIRRGKCGFMSRHTEGGTPREDEGSNWGDATFPRQGMPRIMGNHQELGIGNEGFFLRAFWNTVALWIPWFQTAGLQNYERVNFCCVRPPGLWSFIWQF